MPRRVTRGRAFATGSPAIMTVTGEVGVLRLSRCAQSLMARSIKPLRTFLAGDDAPNLGLRHDGRCLLAPTGRLSGGPHQARSACRVGLCQLAGQTRSKALGAAFG